MWILRPARRSLQEQREQPCQLLKSTALARLVQSPRQAISIAHTNQGARSGPKSVHPVLSKPPSRVLSRAISLIFPRDPEISTRFIPQGTVHATIGSKASVCSARKNVALRTIAFLLQTLSRVGSGNSVHVAAKFQLGRAILLMWTLGTTLHHRLDAFVLTPVVPYRGKEADSAVRLRMPLHGQRRAFKTRLLKPIRLQLGYQSLTADPTVSTQRPAQERCGPFHLEKMQTTSPASHCVQNPIAGS